MVSSQVYHLVELCEDVSALCWLCNSQGPLTSKTGDCRPVGLYEGLCFCFHLFCLVFVFMCNSVSSATC